MARKKLKHSTTSFDGLGLTKEEDAKLIKLLKDKDISMSQLKRQLIRNWIAVEMI